MSYDRADEWRPDVGVTAQPRKEKFAIDPGWPPHGDLSGEPTHAAQPSIIVSGDEAISQRCPKCDAPAGEACKRTSTLFDYFCRYERVVLKPKGTPMRMPHPERYAVIWQMKKAEA